MERAGCPRAMLYGKHKRIWELDYFRGVCVLLMIVYHAMYDLRSFSYVWQLRDQDFYPLYQLSVRFFLAPGLHLQDFLAPVFFFIAGISTSLSRNAPVRFTKVIVSAFLVSCCSALMNLNITLGVLHCLGYCMLLYYLLERLFYDDRAYFALAVTLCAAMLIRRSCGLDRMISPSVAAVFPSELGPVLEYVGLICRTHADYYPLSPWFGIFLLGVLFGRNAYLREKASLLPSVRRPLFAPVEWIGRHALWIYLLHQPLLYGIFEAISLLL